MLRHEKFEEMCALKATGQLAAQEEQQLEEHCRSHCSSPEPARGIPFPIPGKCACTRFAVLRRGTTGTEQTFRFFPKYFFASPCPRLRFGCDHGRWNSGLLQTC